MNIPRVAVVYVELPTMLESMINDEIDEIMTELDGRISDVKYLPRANMGTHVFIHYSVEKKGH